MGFPEKVVSQADSGLYEFDRFRIDTGRRLLWSDGDSLAIPSKALDTLAYLVRHAGQTVTKDELMAAVWPDTVVEENNLNKNISALRQLLGEKPGEHRFIATVPGRGYRFVAEVSEIRDEAEYAEIAYPGIPRALPGETAPYPAESRPLRIRTNWRGWWRHWMAWAALGALVGTGVLIGWKYLRQSSTPSPRRVMLAVLPLKNLSGDPNQEYIVDGLTEEIITDLGRMSPEQMGVIARTSAMAYKNTEKTVSQIGKELGVDYVLEGSVRSQDGKARVSAQLIRVSDQTHLWAKNYDRDLKNLLEIEDELGQNMAQQVRLNLSPQREIEFAKMRTADPEAYDLYLRGRYFWNQRTPPAMKQSIEYFQAAIAKDPEFAQAYAGLAAAYNLSYNMGLYSAQESSLRAKAAATKALELDPSIAEAHTALGKVKSHYDFDFAGAEKEFLKALELNPNSADAHFFYANSYLLPMGRMKEAIAENKKALELDPLSLPMNAFLGNTYAWARDYDKSYEQFQHTIKMNPNFPLTHSFLSLVLQGQGKYREAIKEFEKTQLLLGVPPAVAAAEAGRRLGAFEEGGERGYWQYLLQQTQQDAQRDPSAGWPGGGASSPTGMAMLYARLGDKDKAFYWLDRACEEREGQILTMLKVNPNFDSLREDPRYRALLQKMGLPE